MPFYEIQYSLPLTSEQRQSLAEKLTENHATMFTCPSLFVNVRFTSMQDEEGYFTGGKRRPGTNRIMVFIRSGGNRGYRPTFDKLAQKIEEVWDQVVGPKGEGPEKVLQAVAIIPGLTAREEGFDIPIPGDEPHWLRKNIDAFKKRADEGDEEFKDLLAEIERRPELLKVIPKAGLW